MTDAPAAKARNTLQRLTIGASLAAFSIAWIFLAYYASTARRVWMVNGFDRQYGVVLHDGRRISLEPGKPFEIPYGLGKRIVRVERSWGPPLDVVVDNSVPFLLGPFGLTKEQFVNPDMSAVFVTDTTEYSISSPNPDQRWLYYGSSWYSIDTDYVFAPFPDSVSAHGNSIFKKRVWVPSSGAEALDLVEVVDGAKFREKLVEKRKSFEAEGDGNSRE